MSRQIDFNQPLSDEDRAWLHEWSQDWRIEENERRFGQAEQPEVEDQLPHVQSQPDLDGNQVDSQPESGADGQGPETDDDDDDDDDDGLSLEEQIAQLTIDQLKDELEELGEPVTGSKKELQEHLLKALESR